MPSTPTKMHIHKFSYVLLTLLIATSCNPLLFSSFGGKRIAAETADARKQEATRLFQQGIKQFQTSQFEAALQSWRLSLSIYRQINDRKGESQSLGNLSITYKNLGDYKNAVDYYQQALTILREIKDRQGESYALTNLGNVYNSLGDYKSAIGYYQQSLTILREIKDRKGEAETLGNIGLVYLYLGDFKSAIDYNQQDLKIAREIKDSQGEGAALGNIGLANNFLGNYAGAINYYQQALKITLRKTDLKPLWQQENTSLDKLVTTVRNNIGTRGISYRGLQVSNDPDNTNTKNNLRRLHKLLIDPIANLLPKNENDKVAFIPQQSLFLVPFPALQDDNGKYLIEKHTILTSPSIQVLDLTRKQREAQKTPLQDVLIVGNPTMPSVLLKIGAPPQQLAPLPGAEKEAKAIGNLFNTKPLIGNEATKAAVLERLPHILHL